MKLSGSLRPPDLVTIRQIAQEFRVSKRVVWRWKAEDPNFPKPLMGVGKANEPLYSLVAVRIWWDNYEELVSSGGHRE